MSFNRNQLPDPVSYYEGEGLILQKGKTWRTTSCNFHGGSDSMRVNVTSGAWRCMACNESGGDVLAYQMRAHDMEFVEACKALGCWIEDGKAPTQHKPTSMSPRAALQCLAFEGTLIAMVAALIARGAPISEADKDRALVAAGRFNSILEEFSC